MVQTSPLIRRACAGLISSLRLAACVAVLAFGVHGAAAAGFRFAWMTDTHVGSKNGAEDLTESVREINALPDIAFVIVSGDISDFGTREQLTQAKEILAGLHVPLHIIPGNHDTKWSESGATDFARIFGDERFAFTHEGYVFVGTHEGPILRMSDGHFAPQDLNWLDDTLAKMAGARQPVIFVTHYPIDPSITNWYEALDRLKKYNTQAALFGHGHANHHYTFEGLPGVMSRANVRDAQKPGGFTIVTVEDGKMTIAEQRHGVAEPRVWHTIALGDRAAVFAAAKPEKRPDFSINEQFPVVKPRWSVTTGATIVSAPVLWRDRAILGDASGAVKAYAVDSGKVVWSFQTGGPVRATVAVDDDTVVVPSTDGVVYALNASDGKPRWRVTTERAIIACPAIADGVVYLGSSEGRFRALRLTDGKILWEFSGVKGFIETRALVRDGKVYFGAWDRNFYALDAKTGALAWKWQVPHEGYFYSPAACWPVAAAGKIFIVEPERKVIALDARTGALIWDYTENSPARESIGLSEDGQRIYVTSMKDAIRAFATEPTKAEVVWTNDLKLGAEFNGAMLAEKDGVMFYGTKNGMILALDGKTGAVRWQHRFGVAALNTIVPLSGTDVLATDHSGRFARVAAGAR